MTKGDFIECNWIVCSSKFHAACYRISCDMELRAGGIQRHVTNSITRERDSALFPVESFPWKMRQEMSVRRKKDRFFGLNYETKAGNESIGRKKRKRKNRGVASVGRYLRSRGSLSVEEPRPQLFSTTLSYRGTKIHPMVLVSEQTFLK